MLDFLRIEIPAGVADHGTDLDSKGRWIDSQLVRWTNGRPHPIGGWDTFASSSAGSELIQTPDLVQYQIDNPSGPAPSDWTFDSGTAWNNASGALITAGSTGTLNATIHQDIGASLTIGNRYIVTATINSTSTADGAKVVLVLDGLTSPDFPVTSGRQYISHEFVYTTSASGPKTGLSIVSLSDGGGAAFVELEEISVKELTSVSVDTVTNGVPRGAKAWFDLTDAPYLAFGTYNSLQMINGNGVLFNISPTDLVTGIPESAQNTGYGGGAYGAGAYGTPRSRNYTIAPATSWTLDNFGEDLIACSDADGRILTLDMSAFRDDDTTKAAALSGAPTANRAAVVTQERFIFALGAGGNPRQVEWCDRENPTQWTPAVTNEAGDFELSTNGELVCGLSVRGRTLLLTTEDAWVANYQGPPLVYGFQKVGGSCGVVARNMAVAVGQTAFWMGENNFYAYDGSQVQAIPCEVHDKVFQDIRRSRFSHGFAVANQQFNEVWWFYPGDGDDEATTYVGYDYQDNHWIYGSLSRSAGVGGDVFGDPIWFGSDGGIYRHEVSYGHDGEQPYLETAPINFSDGNNVFHVLQALTSTEGMDGTENLEFWSRYHDDDQWYRHRFGDIGSNPIPLRFSGRQMKYRITLPDGVDWRWRDLRIRFKPGGRR